MLIFLAINLIFMFVEFFYGVYSNSLGLISDAFHMFSDCCSLLVALAAAYISMSREANAEYSYGYARAEVLSGFFNGVFLIFVAFNVFIESIERIYEPQYIEGSSLLLVSVLGLLVNLVGLVFFHEHAHGGGECSHGHSHDHGHDHSNAHEHKLGPGDSPRTEQLDGSEDSEGHENH
jgi:solute carrier family 30 (zinc transporter), member 5/7